MCTFKAIERPIIENRTYNIIVTDFKDYVNSLSHPCIMAKTVFAMDNYTLKVYENMQNENAALALNQDISNFIKNYNFTTNQFQSFLACFKNDNFTTEIEFENALWNLLQNIHNCDDKVWDDSVSSNSASNNFSFSIKGRGFYVVGLHPKSSRIARQSPYATVVFNLHWQFEKLREMGTFQKTKARIRKNDIKIQGSINPVLKDFGSESETKQYSGRNVGKHWKCPFTNNNNKK